MTPDPKSRKTPAHFPVHSRGNLSRIIFLTVCTKERRRILATPEAHAVMLDAWTQADQWSVGRYVIMPDHIHLFCVPGCQDYPSLKKWVQFWKSRASQKWPHPEQQPVWQADFWDRQMRRGESYSAKWEYVRLNPVRQGLVQNPESWPYQGELNVLWWHDP